MSGLLILTLAGQWSWHTVKLYQKCSEYGWFEKVFVDSRDRPVVIVQESWQVAPGSLETQWLCFWWNGSGWDVDTLPSWMGEFRDPSEFAWLMGEDDSLWMMTAQRDTSFPGPPYYYPRRITFFHGRGYVWDSLPSFLDTLSGAEDQNMPETTFLDTPGVPCYISCNIGSWPYDSVLRVYRFSGGAWNLEYVVKPLMNGSTLVLSAEKDSQGHIHVLVTTTMVVDYTTNETGSWTWETIDSIPGGDFLWSRAWMFIDDEGQIHVFDDPYTREWLVRYLFRDTMGAWHIVDSSIAWTGALSNHVVDGNGIIHFVCENGPTFDHWHKPADQPGPWAVDFLTDSGDIYTNISSSLAVDRQGYLYLVYTDWDGTIYLATTNPDIGLSEGEVKPRPALTLSPVPHGFIISGYSGPARIYDPAGRLVLQRQVKDKARINPLRPGVYFVVAGKQRAKVAVR